MKWWPITSEKASMLRGLDLALVEAEGTEQQVQVIHAPVADAPQALGDGRVTPGPVADR